MAITTYAELQTAIADFLNRSDLTSVVPDFIALAEAGHNRSIRHWRMEARSTLTASTQYTALPSDFVEPIRLAQDGAYRALRPISYGEMQDRRAAYDDTAADPVYYAISNDDVELFPTPDESMTINIHYYQRVPALSDSNTRNWLLTYHPDVYLYGALVHAAPYLIDDPRLTVWAALYSQGVDAVNKDGRRGSWGGGPLVMR